MFGHQDEQHHHHDGDTTPIDNVLSTDDGGSTMHDDFNPALPPADDISTPAIADEVVSAPAVAADHGDLLDIKQQALTALSPLVGHLDQSPEEKFRTTMMLIQASDNKELIKDAYTAAQAITEEKVKAQALLDIVNEINYFTQQTA